MTRLRKSGMGQRLVIYADAFDSAFLSCKRDLNKAGTAAERWALDRMGQNGPNGTLKSSMKELSGFRGAPTANLLRSGVRLQAAPTTPNHDMKWFEDV